VTGLTFPVKPDVEFAVFDGRKIMAIHAPYISGSDRMSGSVIEFRHGGAMTGNAEVIQILLHQRLVHVSMNRMAGRACRPRFHMRIRRYHGRLMP
jgi:hypothetical protein